MCRSTSNGFAYLVIVSIIVSLSSASWFGPDTTVFPYGRRLAAAKLRSLMHLYYDTKAGTEHPGSFRPYLGYPERGNISVSGGDIN